MLSVFAPRRLSSGLPTAPANSQHIALADVHSRAGTPGPPLFQRADFILRQLGGVGVGEFLDQFGQDFFGFVVGTVADEIVRIEYGELIA